jgi:hypothetical protein
MAFGYWGPALPIWGDFPSCFRSLEMKMKIDSILLRQYFNHLIPGGSCSPLPPSHKSRSKAAELRQRAICLVMKRPIRHREEVIGRAEGNMFIVIFKVNPKPRLWKEGRGSSGHSPASSRTALGRQKQAKLADN